MNKSKTDDVKSILLDIKRQLMQTMYERTERWVEADTLSKEIECLSASWMKQYAKLLPRTRAEVRHEDGTVRCSHWVYPLHKINEMFANGQIKNLTI